MRDLIKYEYIEDDANIPENQFGLGYTNLVMIIACLLYTSPHAKISSGKKGYVIALRTGPGMRECERTVSYTHLQ